MTIAETSVARHTGFDIQITLADSAQRWANHPIHAVMYLQGEQARAATEASEGDEFDLDIRFAGPVAQQDSSDVPLEKKEAWGIFSITCGNTCGITCGNTCQVLATCTCTCGNTCGVTCGNTCQVIATCTCTCGNTCGVTCGNTCGVTCGHTCQILASCTCTCPGKNTCQGTCYTCGYTCFGYSCVSCAGYTCQTCGIECGGPDTSGACINFDRKNPAPGP